MIGVLRKATDEGGHCVFRTRAVAGVHGGAKNRLHVIAQRRAQQASEVVRRIRSGIVEGLAEAGATVVRFRDVSAKLESVFALHPAKIVGPVVDRSDS